jgi:iron-sulfur cluster repair protein YtfE (RIC family)
MLTRLGKGPRSDDRSLLGRLLDCHERIREMIALAVRLGSDPRPAEQDVVDAADRVVRYFQRALPNHVLDEEESILPRLAALDADVATALGRMRDEHREHEPHLEALLAACMELGDAPGRWGELRGEVRHHAERLRDAFAAHLEQEERDVFPKLAGLGPAVERDIVREMEARREARGGGGGGRGRGGAGRGRPA